MNEEKDGELIPSVVKDQTRSKTHEDQTKLVNLRTVDYMANFLNQDPNQWLELSTELSEDQGFDYEFIGVTDIQLNVQIIKQY